MNFPRFLNMIFPIRSKYELYKDIKYVIFKLRFNGNIILTDSKTGIYSASLFEISYFQKSKFRVRSFNSAKFENNIPVPYFMNFIFFSYSWVSYVCFCLTSKRLNFLLKLQHLTKSNMDLEV